MNEVDIGRDFAGFWKNFMTTFNMQHRKVYITGESYAGQYIPYIASYMLDQNDTTYYNVKGVQINDPSIGDDGTLIEGMHQRGPSSILFANHPQRPLFRPSTTSLPSLVSMKPS